MAQGACPALHSLHVPGRALVRSRLRMLYRLANGHLRSHGHNLPRHTYI